MFGGRDEAVERRQHRDDDVAEPLAAWTEELAGHHLADCRAAEEFFLFETFLTLNLFIAKLQ